MRRAEMARRRRNLSEKRNEEVKVRRPSLATPMISPYHHYSFLLHPCFVISSIKKSNH